MNIENVQLMARYNQHVNGEMNKILQTLTPQEWNKEFTGYFKSIYALCKHLYIADTNWLNRFKNIRQHSSLNVPVLDTVYSWDAMPFATFDEYLGLRQKVDSVFIAFVNELTTSDLSGNLQYKNFKGISQSRNVGGLVMHVFNHQTHHRGMIALYLDMLGKENDFSNLASLV